MATDKEADAASSARNVKKNSSPVKVMGIPKHPGVRMAEHRIKHVGEHSSIMSWLGRPAFPVKNLDVSFLCVFPS